MPAVTAFPVVGNVSYIDDFGDPRLQGRHEGNDIMAIRHQPAVAFERGKVEKHVGSSMGTCMLYLHGASGMTYIYIHLNNDLTMKNDNRGGCRNGVSWAPGLRNGQTVRRGQLVGYVGDSGDADGIHPHLHFEVHPNARAAANPFPHLNKARRLLFAAQPGTTFTLALSGKVANAAGEDLQVTVDHVRQWPGGRKVKQTGQKVPVTVPETASIEGVGPAGAAALSPYPSLELLTKGLPVTVWTSPAKVTFAALAGAKGALAASRVVVRP